MVTRVVAVALSAPLFVSSIALAEEASPPSAAAAPVEAQPAAVDSPESEAQAAFFEGLRHLRQEQWAQAEVSFRRSLALVPRTSARYNLALVLFKQHREKESLALLEELLAGPTSAEDQRYRDYATTLKPLVLAQMASFEFEVRPPDASVRIDGELVHRAAQQRGALLEPGAHRIEASRAGYQKRMLEISAVAGARYHERIELIPLSQVPRARTGSSASATTRTPVGERHPSSLGPWITMGAGAALLAGAAVTGFLALREDKQFSDDCPTNKACSHELDGQQARVVRLGHITDALLISGSVLVAGGVTWKLLTPSVTTTGRNGATEFAIGARGRF